MIPFLQSSKTHAICVSSREETTSLFVLQVTGGAAAGASSAARARGPSPALQGTTMLPLPHPLPGNLSVYQVFITPSA